MDEIIARVQKCWVGDEHSLEDYYSHDQITLKCDQCPHYFTTTKNSLLLGAWCRYCAPFNGILCGEDDCSVCYKKSFANAYPWYIPYLDDSNSTPLHALLPNSRKEFITFRCPQCKHRIIKTPNSLNKHKFVCIYCTRGALCDDESCTYCEENSMRSNPAYEFMIDKYNARKIRKGSKTIVKLGCKKCGQIFTRRADYLKDAKCWNCRLWLGERLHPSPKTPPILDEDAALS
jgi:uncharacterized C2H2 Zn-finger protein